MRGSVPGLTTPYPLGAMLPAYLQEDQFATRWIAGFDDVLAPVIGVLDCVDAYIDPHLAPEDFAFWLASWVAAVTDEKWPIERQRRAVASAVELQAARGTVGGLVAQLELATGGTVELIGAGSVTWGREPDPSFPAHAEPRLLIRITVPDPSTVSVAAVNSIVEVTKPAHVPHEIEVAGDDRLS